MMGVWSGTSKVEFILQNYLQGASHPMIKVIFTPSLSAYLYICWTEIGQWYDVVQWHI